MSIPDYATNKKPEEKTKVNKTTTTNSHKSLTFYYKSYPVPVLISNKHEFALDFL